MYVVNMKTPDGFRVVFISDWFFDTLEKNMNAIARIPGGAMGSPFPMVALRDEPAKVEFRHLTEAQNMGRFLGAQGGKSTLKKYGKDHFSRIGKIKKTRGIVSSTG